MGQALVRVLTDLPFEITWIDELRWWIEGKILQPIFGWAFEGSEDETFMIFNGEIPVSAMSSKMAARKFARGAPKVVIRGRLSARRLLRDTHQRARRSHCGDYRSVLNAARISVAKSSGSSQAAKWPPLSTVLK